MKNKAILIPIFLVVAFFSVQLAQAFTSNTVGTTTTYGIRVPQQHLGFLAKGLYWQFYNNGSNEVFKTSSDAVNWSSESTVISGISAGALFGTYFDGRYIHYTRTANFGGESLFYRRGVPNSNGTITWSTAEQTASSTGGIIGDPTITVDTAGYPWLGYAVSGGGGYGATILKASTNDGTWTTQSGFPYTLKDTNTDDFFTTPVALSNGNVYAVGYDLGSPISVNPPDTPVFGRLWNGSSWGSEETVSTSVQSPSYYEQNSTVAVGNDVYFTFQKASTFDLIAVRRTFGVGWGSEMTVQTGGVASSSPNLSTDGTNVWAFWSSNPVNNHVYVKKYTASTNTWDSSPTDIADESANTISAPNSGGVSTRGGWGGTWQAAINNKIGVYYTTGTSPSTVKLLLYEIAAPFFKVQGGRVRVQGGNIRVNN